MFTKILVPTDGSPLSDAAINRAIAFAKTLNARIVFFYARAGFPLPVYGEGALLDPTTPEQFEKTLENEAREILNKAKSIAEAAGVECEGDSRVCEAPYEAIIESAQRNHCDLIFMASHGRKGIAGLLLGSETQKVLTHSKIPVLVYR